MKGEPETLLKEINVLNKEIMKDEEQKKDMSEQVHKPRRKEIKEDMAIWKPQGSSYLSAP